MTGYISGFSNLLEEFTHYRAATGVWNSSYERNLRTFDLFCAKQYPGAPLSQEMVDGWCLRKETELNNSCRSRTFVVHDFVNYLRDRNLTVNINSWETDTFEFTDRLHILSKSMGHQKLQSTLYYYSIVPRLAETLQELTEVGFNEIVPDPEVSYEE